MHFSIIILLGLNFLLCQRVSSLQNSVFQNQILSIDETPDSALGKFFTKFSNVYLKKNPPRQVTIIAASNDQLRQAQSIIESYPYSICTDPEKCVYPRNVISPSFFIVFLSDLGQATLRKHFNILSGGIDEYETLFVFEGVIFTNSEIVTFLSQASNLGAAHCELVHLVEDGIKVYSPYLEKNCSIGAELISNPEIHLSKRNKLGLKLDNLKRCPILMGSFQYMPQMVIEEKDNGSLTIVGGRDGMLVLLIAEKLNFTADLRYPSKSDERGYSKKSALIKDVISGAVKFGISRMRPTNQSGISMSFDDECITWAVPRMAAARNLLWIEFPLETWALIITVFIIICAIGYIHDVISSGNANQQGVKIGKIILNAVSMNLGNAATNQPVSIAGKIMMIAYLYYSLVITTAYKASLDSILATFKGSSTITDTREIFEQNLEVGGSSYHYGVLKDQAIESKTVSELIKRYIIYSNDSTAAERIMFDDYFAFLARRSTLNYEKRMVVNTQKLLKFNILDECVLHYPVVLVFRRGSYFLKPVNDIISRIRAAGILDYWDRINSVRDKELERANADRFAGMYNARNFYKIFLFYLGCIFICLVVFIMEILAARCKPKKRQGVAQRNR